MSITNQMMVIDLYSFCVFIQNLPSYSIIIIDYQQLFTVYSKSALIGIKTPYSIHKLRNTSETVTI